MRALTGYKCVFIKQLDYELEISIARFDEGKQHQSTIAQRN